MALFRKKEKRDNHIHDDPFGVFLTSDKINAENALNVPAVSSCISFIANIIASLPIKLYSEDEGKAKEETDDYRLKLLNDETGDLLDAFQAKKAFISDVILQGAGYIYIHKQRNEIKSLHYVDSRSINVMINSDPIFKQADILIQGQRYQPWQFVILTHDTKDGLTGRGIVGKNNDIITAAYNLMIFEQTLYKRGGGKKGFIKAEKKLSDHAMSVLKEAWSNLLSNRAEDKPIVLNEGADFKEISSSAVEMQMNENKDANNIAICSIFNLSPGIINGKASAEEFSNGIKTAVVPLVTAFQTALNKSMLLESEKGKMYYAVDMTELLKGDILKRYQAYASGLKEGFLQIDEVRYKEDLSPLGFDYIKLGLNAVLYNPKTREFYTPNTNQKAKIDGNPDLKGGVTEDESGNQE